MTLLVAVANSSSHAGWSWTAAATWIGGLAGVAYFLELVGFWRRLSRKLPRQRTRPQPASVARVVDAMSVLVAIALVFASGLWWKVGLATTLGAAFVVRLLIGRRRHERLAAPKMAIETELPASAPTFAVSEASEQTEPSPEPRHRVYLRVTNDGPSAPFYAQVVQVTGSVTEPSVPWTIRWRGSAERELTIHHGTTELLDVLEAVPMGHRPHEGDFRPGVMIANTLSGEVEMRIGAQTLDDLYVNELGLAVVVVNVQTGERQNVFLRVGLEHEHDLQPRLSLFHERPRPPDDAPVAAVERSRQVTATTTRRGAGSSGSSRSASVSDPPPRVEFGQPRRTSAKAYHFGDRTGDAFTTIVIPVRARDNKIVNCRSSVTFKAAWADYVHEVPGRWENRTKQPMKGFGENWSELDRITLYKDDADEIAIAVQHEGDDDAYILCNASWEMPLQHGRPDFRHPELLLPRGQVSVEVTVRGDELADASCTFTIEPVDHRWQPAPLLARSAMEELLDLLREGVELSNAIPHGKELDAESLHERAVTSWTHRVRDALIEDYPEWAVQFDVPVRRLPVKLKYRSDELNAEMQFRLERLSWIGQQLRGAAKGDVAPHTSPKTDRVMWRNELHRVEEAVESIGEVVRDEMPGAPDGRLARLFTPTRLPTARRRLAGRLAELESAGGPRLPQCRELAEATWYVFYSQVQAGVFSATDEIARTLETRTM